VLPGLRKEHSIVDLHSHMCVYPCSSSSWTVLSKRAGAMMRRLRSRVPATETVGRVLLCRGFALSTPSTRTTIRGHSVRADTAVV
jgi:hypothetical protein